MIKLHSKNINIGTNNTQLSTTSATLKRMKKYVPSSQVSWPQWKQSASLLPAQK